MRERKDEAALVCVTCKQPILLTDEWSWLDGKGRTPEHDACYAQRFARQFPNANKPENKQ
jgi:hypothetical protein